MPLRAVGSASVKRKAISLANPHPGHETMFCLRSGAARLIRKDDEPRTGDGFGGHGGRAVWEDRCSRPGYQDIKLHCVVEGPPLSGKILLVCDLGFFVKMNGSGAPYQQSDPLARLRRWFTEALHAGHFRRTIRQGAVV